MTAAVQTVALLSIACVAVFGLLVGSFANVVVYRVPAGISIVRPRSACPSCGNPVRAYDNVPVVSWMLLRGRCRDCREPISARYPIVEAIVGALFVVVAIWRWHELASALGTAQIVAQILVLIAFLYLAATSVVLSLIDVDTHRLPNSIVLPGYLVGLALFGGAAVLNDDPTSFITAVVGSASAFALYLTIAVIAPGGMGLGDVKLAGVIGLFLGSLGWAPLIVGVFAAFILGGLYGVALLLLRRAGRGAGIPFGPWMLIAAWVGALAGDAIATAYLGLFGLG